MKVYVLGCTGMLGRYVYRYLKGTGKYKVIGTTRKYLDAEKASYFAMESVGMVRGDVVINCIGQIKQHADVPEARYLALNTLFPISMAKICKDIGAHFIHVTTDCVFKGNGGNYTETATHDAEDIYGISKSMGEPRNCTVIRTSIIGEELKGKASLLEWVKSNAGKTINGFTNHRWNGITCLQFAKICEQIIDKEQYWIGVRHVTSPTAVNKYELSGMISSTFDLGITIKEFETPDPCDRTMESHYVPIFDVPELPVQLQELKDFGNILRLRG